MNLINYSNLSVIDNYPYKYLNKAMNRQGITYHNSKKVREK